MFSPLGVPCRAPQHNILPRRANRRPQWVAVLAEDTDVEPLDVQGMLGLERLQRRDFTWPTWPAASSSRSSSSQTNLAARPVRGPQQEADTEEHAQAHGASASDFMHHSADLTDTAELLQPHQPLHLPDFHERLVAGAVPFQMDQLLERRTSHHTASSSSHHMHEATHQQPHARQRATSAAGRPGSRPAGAQSGGRDQTHSKRRLFEPQQQSKGEASPSHAPTQPMSGHTYHRTRVQGTARHHTTHRHGAPHTGITGGLLNEAPPASQPLQGPQSRAQLAAAITRSTTLRELHELHQQYASMMDALHVSAMLSKAAKAEELSWRTRAEAPPQYQTLLDSLLTQFTQAVQAGQLYQPRQLSAGLWALAKLQLWHRPAGARAAEEAACALAPHLHSLAGRQDGHHLYRHGRAYQHQAVAPDGLSQTSQPQADSQRPSRARASARVQLSAQDVSNTSWALAHMQVSWPGAQGSASHDHKSSSSGRSSSSSSGAGTHSQRPELGWLWQPLAACMPSLAPQMRAQEVSNCLWALARAGCRLDMRKAQPAHAAVSASDQSAATGPQGHGHTKVLSQAVAALCARTCTVCDTLDRQHVANIAWACATMGHRHGPLLDALGAHAAAHIANCTGEGLSQLAWAYATLDYRHPALLNALVRASKWKARKFSGQGLSNLLWGLSHFRLRDLELLSLLAREAVYKLDELQPLGLATLLSAWATARYYNISLFTSVDTVALRTLHTFQPQTLLRLVEACARVGHVDTLPMVAAAPELHAWVDGIGRCSDDNDGSSSEAAGYAAPSLNQLVAITAAYGSSQAGTQPPAMNLLACVAPQLAAAAAERRLSIGQATTVAAAYAQVCMGAAITQHAGAGVGAHISHAPAVQQHLHLTRGSVVEPSTHTPGVLWQLPATRLKVPGQQLLSHPDVQALAGVLGSLLHEAGVSGQLNAQQLVTAAWAMAVLGSLDAPQLLQQALAAELTSRGHIGASSGGGGGAQLTAKWRARLAWAAVSAGARTALLESRQAVQDESCAAALATAWGIEEAPAPAHHQLSAAQQAAAPAYLVSSLMESLDEVDTLSLVHVLQVIASLTIDGGPSVAMPQAPRQQPPAHAPDAAAASLGRKGPGQPSHTMLAQLVQDELLTRLQGASVREVMRLLPVLHAARQLDMRAVAVVRGRLLKWVEPVQQQQGPVSMQGSVTAPQAESSSSAVGGPAPSVGDVCQVLSVLHLAGASDVRVCAICGRALLKLLGEMRAASQSVPAAAAPASGPSAEQLVQALSVLSAACSSDARLVPLLSAVKLAAAAAGLRV